MDNRYQVFKITDTNGKVIEIIKLLKPSISQNWKKFLTKEESEFYTSLSEVEQLDCSLSTDPFNWISNALNNKKMGKSI